MEQTDQYIEHVTNLGDKETVIASEDILSDRGVKLLPKGASINRSRLGQLQKHKLEQEVDQVIYLEDALDSAKIMKHFQQFQDQHPHLKASLKLLKNQEKAIGYFGRIRLNTLMKNKLTVCFKEKPHLFEHSMLVAYASISVADHLSISNEDKDDLITAAMFHDLGMLHIHNDMEHIKEKLTSEQERQIASHPVIMHRILDQFPEYHQVAELILQHHERMDGSGYPKGLTAEKTSLISQTLQAAECAISIYQRQGYHFAISVLKTHMGSQFNTEISQQLVRILNAWHEASNKVSVPHDIRHIKELQKALESSMYMIVKVLPSLKNPFATAPAVAHLATRIKQIQVALANVGLDQGRADAALKYSEVDDELLLEVGDIIYECIFQLMDALRVFRRQLHPDTRVPGDFNQWLKQTESSFSNFMLKNR